MIGLETPTKANDEIGRITTSLSAQWDLRFPPPVARSPAKIDRDLPEEKVLARLRFLFFHDRKNNQAATKYAVDCFEQFAPKLLAGWITKPWAEEDLLPTRTRSATIRQQGFLSKKPALNDEQASDLMQALLRYLDDTISAIRKGAIFSLEHSPRNESNSITNETPNPQTRQPLRRSSRVSTEKISRSPSKSLRNGNIKAFLKQTNNDPTPRLDFHATRTQLPSSDDYKIDDGFFDDVEMKDAPAITALGEPSIATRDIPRNQVLGSSESTGVVEDHYQTPPDSPSKTYVESLENRRLHKNKSWSPTKPTSFSTKSDALPTGGDLQTRKRSFPEMQKPELPRKVSRDNSERGSIHANYPPPFGGTRYPSDAEFNEAQIRDKKTSRSFQKSYSAGSLTSRSSSSGGSMPTTAWTTPNTSFRTETPMTSFSSSIEPLELDNPGRESVHGRRSRQNLKAPFGLGLGMGLDPVVNGMAEVVPMGPPTVMAIKKGPRLSISQLLSASSPFVTVSPKSENTVHLRQLYELCRVSIHTKIPMQEFKPCLKQVFDDYDTLWSALSTIAKQHGAAVPERSSLAAWKQSEQGFRGVALTGSLVFSDQSRDQIFELRLNPLRIDPDFRLARKFGSDRFFVLGIPSIELKNIPSHLRSDPEAREAIIRWILHSEHSFLGRIWRAFYVRPETRKSRGPELRASLQSSKYRVYLFAESGSDFQTGATGGETDPRKFKHSPMTRKELIEWLMPSKENEDQRALKFFARLAIGVSQTTSTVQFYPHQIIRSDDARADTPAIRRLQHKRSNEKKGNMKPVKSRAAVMNDGCARISQGAARIVAEMLHLDSIPSIFQGRIGGAKGVWMVDPLNETIDGQNGIWVEITDSQLKFEAHAMDKLYPAPERVTFEVLDFSRPLTTASLNFQLMPILAERKVPFEVFRNLLEADLISKVADLEVAMGSGLTIRKWNQEVNPVSTTRDLHGVSMYGGIPATTSEKITWFVEHGFEPSSCCRLKDILYSAISAYCFRLENRMNIGVAKSTYAYMIADPLAVLEEGEVHLSFSSPFENETMLHDIDLLVARLPAALPSDIQKVRATYKLELRRYRDVIVFSSKGTRALAEKLSGGDYDGDRAWICWEPDIVDPFENAPVPDALPLKAYGIEPDPTTVKDLLVYDDYIDRFLYHAFSFTLHDSLLGICTSYFEALCYDKNKVSHPSAVKIAHLLGLLVDSAKAGIRFNYEDWDGFLARERLRKNLPRPAYKVKEHSVPANPTHLIDRLVFVVAKGVREKALGDFSRKFKNVGTYDTDLARVYQKEQEEAKTDKGIAQALKDLKSDINKLKDYWSANCTLRLDDLADEGDPLAVSFGSKAALGKDKGRKKSIQSFTAIAEHVRDEFLHLKPSAEAVALSPIVARWARDDTIDSATSPPSTPTSSLPPSHWRLLKASAAFSLFHERNFIWYMAGHELGYLKGQAKGCRAVVTDIWQCMKLDGRAVDRRKGREIREAEGGLYELGADEDGEVEESQHEYGDWTWMEGLEVE